MCHLHTDYIVVHMAKNTKIYIISPLQILVIYKFFYWIFFLYFVFFVHFHFLLSLTFVSGNRGNNNYLIELQCFEGFDSAETT